jgi:glycosyltransferase involved in cell wall biosynthesis
MKFLFVGPRLLAGIGQVTKRYADLVGGEYVEFGAQPKEQWYDRGFAFMLPLENNVLLVDQYMTFCKEMMHMTICETEPVNEAYGMLTKYKTLYVASEFCKEIFERQFPEVNWKVLRLYAEGVPRAPKMDGPYVFYTIGNMMDPRKNVRSLLRAFEECDFPNARLLIKATCNSEFKFEKKDVIVINGLLSQVQMENVHARGHCYINCSHSEGVGMGAVEAALRGKPVIITDYGGLKEYVKTPWVIRCVKGPIGFDDFLFKKEHEWGWPMYEDLVTYMKFCYQNNVREFNHEFTRKLMEDVEPTLTAC